MILKLLIRILDNYNMVIIYIIMCFIFDHRKNYTECLCLENIAILIQLK